ncbi:copper resistance protein NlpE [Flavobacterium sp. JP2137]|uniref:copper resistance protein NlpE n=1 Tax=Flavobacterium sp. JP2137 TaxID=3414510 RepID=UPI003D2FFB66
MKKIFAVLPVLALFVVSCNSSKKEATTTAADSLTTSTEVVDMHNAETSLDIAGTYKGVLPCADCEGIETVIELKDDNSYVVTTVYLTEKTGEKTFKETGTWSIKISTVSLQSDAKDAPEPTQFFAGENTLTHLDEAGNKIEGALAENYILRK